MTTAYDPSRRYLVPVAPLALPLQPDHTHLAVMSWNARIEAWLTGEAICGRSVAQGEIEPGGTLCPDCGERMEDYKLLLEAGPAHWPDDGLSDRRRLLEVCGLLSQWGPDLREAFPVLFRKLDALLKLTEPGEVAK